MKCVCHKWVPQKSLPITTSAGTTLCYSSPTVHVVRKTKNIEIFTYHTQWLCCELLSYKPSPTASNQHWKHFYNKWQFLYACYELVLIQIICLMAVHFVRHELWSYTHRSRLVREALAFWQFHCACTQTGWYQSHKCHLACSTWSVLAPNHWQTGELLPWYVTNLDQCWRHFVPQSSCFWAGVVLFLHWWNLQTVGAQVVAVSRDSHRRELGEKVVWHC